MKFRESFFTNPGPGGNVMQVAKCDGGRVMLAFSSDNIALSKFTTVQNPAANQGLIMATQNPHVVLTLRDWGLGVQCDWFHVAQGFIGENITVWEMLVDTIAEMNEVTFGARPAGNAAFGLGERVRPPAGFDASFQSPLDVLAQKVKGKLWAMARKPN